MHQHQQLSYQDSLRICGDDSRLQAERSLRILLQDSVLSDLISSVIISASYKVNISKKSMSPIRIKTWLTLGLRSDYLTAKMPLAIVPQRDLEATKHTIFQGHLRVFRL